MALSTQVAGSSFQWKYDVFLSFRGEDTRKGFTDHLHDKLRWRGIRTFRDDPDLERGTSISPELLLAIEHSRFAIVVLSPNYASSTWCLLELCKILECMGERGTILPIFYEVDPSHVRHQRGSFAEAFGEHVEKFGEDSKEVDAWRDALRKVANLAGWNSKDYRYETKLVNDIIKLLWTKVNPTFTVFYSSEELVGMENKLEHIDDLLDREANDVRFIGIWGMGGVGKTTLARMVYEKISHQFEVCIFLANVRSVSATHGLVRLQKQILSQILNEEKVQVWNVYDGSTRIRECVCDKAVLLVLDDVDQVEQLETLVKEKGWFGLRSRIIITTRNRQILVTHGIEAQYELHGLDPDDALQLFSWKAFRKYEPEKDYAEYSKSFVMYAAGLPLSLKTLGSFLYKRSPLAWRSALRKLEQLPNTSVFEILKISFDGLDEMEKKVFLDIACFHRLYFDELLIERVYSSELCTRIVIDVLIEKCLLSFVLENNIEIHEMVEEMGREIVRRECSEEPGGRSRLWLRKDIFHVFKNNTGTKVIEGIFLQLDELEEAADWNFEAFSIMSKLKLLHIHNLRLSVGPKCLPNALRFLKWSWYPLKSLPPGFQPDELTELCLAHSNINHLWDGVKHLGKLKSLDLSHSIKLTRTPDFTGIQNLERLVLEGCTNLVHVHQSIAFLKRLKILNFRNCKSIKCLPSKLEMESLETFDVFGCSKLKIIPEFGESMNRLSKLYISGTAIEKLPSSIERFSKSLVELDLSGVVTRGLPYSHFFSQNLTVSSFGLFSRKNPLSTPLLPSLEHFTSLSTLNLNDCNLGEGDIPNSIGYLSSLMNLLLRGNNFVSLPASINLLSKLEYMNVENCKSLRKLPDLPLNDRLSLRTDNCTSLQMFPHPQDVCRVHTFLLVSTNCSSTGDKQDSSYFLYSLLKRLLEETHCSFYYYSFIIPGSEIFEWFSDQRLGDSVTAKLPSDASNRRKFIGIAVCALLVPQDDPSAIPEDDELDPDTSQILCTWNGYSSGVSAVGFSVKKIVADHLYFVVLHKRFLKPKYCLESNCNEVKFVFEINRAVGNNRCLQVKKCGAYALYKHDMEEIDSKSSSSSSSLYMEETVDCDIDELEYEQGGAIVKGTSEAGPSTSGNCEDKYYSAEE